MSSLGRALIEACLPEWEINSDGDLSKALDGLADSIDTYLADIEATADIQNPLKTTMLSDLEEEYGILTNLDKTEADRRAAVLAAKSGGQIDGSLDDLQDVLDRAGFNLTVHENNPAIDPEPIVSQAFVNVCGDPESVCGVTEVVCGYAHKGGLLVNGDVFNDSIFSVPTDSGYWPLVFFVGGAATYNGDGSIAYISIASIPVARRDEIKRLILKYKPMHSWCGLLVYFS